MKKEEEQPSEEVKEEGQKKTTFGILLIIRSFLINLLILSIIGGGAYWLYLNPQIFQKQTNTEKEKANETLVLQINQLQNQIASLRAQIMNIPAPDYSAFEDKVAALEKINLNVIDSKADAAIVLGMLTRVDKLENRLDKLVKISDDGALVLSAAMLVKQAAEEGGDFIYEAEILNQLTPETASIKKDVSVIVEYAHNGVAFKKSLIHDFKKIYAESQVSTEEPAKNWKERLNDKLNEYIKINKAGENAIQIEQNTDFENLAKIVSDGQIYKAIKLIESSESDAIKQNQSLQKWLVDAKNMMSFNQAIRNIAAYSLAEMKVNNLKNKD